METKLECILARLLFSAEELFLCFSVCIYMLNIRVNVKVREFQFSCIFSCILILFKAPYIKSLQQSHIWLSNLAMIFLMIGKRTLFIFKVKVMISKLTIFEIFQWMLRLCRTSGTLLLFFIMTSQLKHWKHYEFEFICVYVTCNDMSVIYVTAQMCRRAEGEVEPTVGLPTPLTFRRFLQCARPTPTRYHPFYTVIPTHSPISSPFKTCWGYGGRILELKHP